VDYDDSITVDFVVSGVVKGIYNVVFVQGWGMGCVKCLCDS
jgi:hypothetical protein